MLRLAACLEEHFPHSMANAVVEAAAAEACAMRNAMPRWSIWWRTASPARWMGNKCASAVPILSSRTRRCAFRKASRKRFDTLPPEFSQLYLAIDGVLSRRDLYLRPPAGGGKDVFSALRRLGVKRDCHAHRGQPRTAAAIAAQLG